jgi:hypothetical protein
VGPTCRRRCEEERERESGGPAGELGWAAWAERVAGALLFFFFSNFIFKSFFNSNSNQTFANFSQKFFIDFLETTQATKNHASQLMMHIHLLSLSLLNYL